MDKEETEAETKGGEYYFLQEAVREHRKGRVRRCVRRLAMVIVVAFVFGASASVAAWSVQNVLKGRDEKAQRETMLADVSEGTAPTTQSTQAGEDSQMLSAYENYWSRVSDVGQQCNKAVVSIARKRTESWYQKSESDDDAQSGLIFSEKDTSIYVLTQASSIVGEHALSATFCDGTRAEATVCAEDDALQIVVLEVSKEGLPESLRKDICIMNFGEYAQETDLELNERVLIFGSPNGILKSVVPGNVVNTSLTAEAVDGGLHLYATDIVYAKDGNGFVADVAGRVVGMLTNAYQDVTGESNWAFVSIADLAPVAVKMTEGKKMASLGVQVCDSSGTGECAGVYVTSVELKSPAYHGGIRVADVIKQIDGCKIEDARGLRLCLAAHEPGDRLEITVCREHNGTDQKKIVRVTLK